MHGSCFVFDIVASLSVGNDKNNIKESSYIYAFQTKCSVFSKSTMISQFNHFENHFNIHIYVVANVQIQLMYTLAS